MKREIDFMKKQECDECGRNTIVNEFEFTILLQDDPPPHLKLCRNCTEHLGELINE